MMAPVLRRILCPLAACLCVLAVACGGAAAAARPRVTASTVLHAPVRSVHLPWGRIGYRAVGRGSPLVIIMGLSGSIDTWPPGFVAALARHHRVIALDNEGIGMTTLRPGPLSIPRMADDTAALVRALHLGRPDVLGWSLGGFIAQAYAVRHPALIRRLVLSATAPGNGKGVLPSSKVLGALTGGAAGLVNYLFPKDQAQDVAAFITAISAYPELHFASAAVTSLQLAASSQWLSGKTGAGRHESTLRLPTLVGDGAEDVILPTANSRVIHRLIKGSRLRLYPDAGHGFIFQDAAAWAGAVNRFLAARTA
jgi:pimeloyl-ACP methyl ester carboxylesterase